MEDSPQRSNHITWDSDREPGSDLQSWLLGRPLRTADAPHQTIGRLIGLAVFSSDALSSVAYGPQELMVILLVAGTSALHLAFPLVAGIVALLAVLTISYEQTIHAYPGGGGAYIVARDNLGELPAQTAGAALLTDYILTVAVSISSGVAQLISAYPRLHDYRVGIAVVMIALIMLINLRGVRESGITFAIPTYFFLVMMFITLVLGMARYAGGTLGTVISPPDAEIGILQPVTMFLLMRAFANGTTSLTGVEAISNGITAFKEPRSRNAGATLVWMSCILGSMLLMTALLAVRIEAIPSESETIISQIARTVFLNNRLLYLATISSTTIILIMAANTAFADFPRLGALHAGDGFLPRQFTLRGSRLVFSYGIAALAAISAFLVIIFRASVTALIPLYAIGVFLSFTLSQTGMAKRWWKSGHLKPGEKIIEKGSTVVYEKSWFLKMVINGIGATMTAIVMIIFAVTKFKDGAWIVVVLTPILVSCFFAIHRHYKHVAAKLSLDAHVKPLADARTKVIVPIGGVHKGTLAALHYARELTRDITIVHVAIDPQETECVKSRWETWGDGHQLVLLNSPYRLLLGPLLEYIDEVLASLGPERTMTIIVPRFVSRKWWTNILHMHTADTLRKVLLNRDNVVVTEVPYHLY